MVRTCLGPQAMLKMLMDPMGGIVMTNDGNAILREITVQHPAAKSMIEIARTQDEEVGDGTTSVIVLAGEMLAVSEPFLHQQIHPTVIIRAYREALEDILTIATDKLSVQLDKGDKKKLHQVFIFKYTSWLSFNSLARSFHLTRSFSRVWAPSSLAVGPTWPSK